MFEAKMLQSMVRACMVRVKNGKMFGVNWSFVSEILLL